MHCEGSRPRLVSTRVNTPDSCEPNMSTWHTQGICRLQLAQGGSSHVMRSIELRVGLTQALHIIIHAATALTVLHDGGRSI